MPTMNFNLIGAGRLGKTIIFSLLNSNLAELMALCNTTLESAHAAAKLLGAGKPISSLTELEPTDMLFITVPDDQIASIASILAEQQIIKPGTIVIHCSGVLSSAILDPLARLGCYTASLHPLKVFASSDTLDPNTFCGCYCTVEGAPQAVNALTPLFKHLGAILIAIQPEQKTIYHAAAVIASNYLVTLAATSTKLLEATGIDVKLARLMIQQLMQSSLNAVHEAGVPKDALTGPLARGDAHTIKHHIEALDELNETNIRQLYCATALATLPLTKLDVEQQKEMRALFMDWQAILTN